MGFFGEVFGISSGSRDEPSSSGSIFGSGSSIFGGGTPHDSPSPAFSYGEPIPPAASQVRGYGGQMFGSVSAADKSLMHDFGGQPTVDPDTGYTGTPQEIYDRYLREGRDPSRLVKNFRRW